MANEQERPADTSRNKLKTAGESTLKIALLGVVCSFILYLCGNGSDRLGLYFYALAIILVSLLLVVVGVILLACGSKKNKKQKNQNIPPA